MAFLRLAVRGKLVGALAEARPIESSCSTDLLLARHRSPELSLILLFHGIPHERRDTPSSREVIQDIWPLYPLRTAHMYPREDVMDGLKLLLLLLLLAREAEAVWSAIG